MEPFVLQPTYSLHSLLRPNRSLGMVGHASEPARQDVGEDARKVDSDQVLRELCNA